MHPSPPSSQFTSDGLNDIKTGPDAMIYISSGVGANKNAAVDYGQFGTDPCTPTGQRWGGSFRTQLALPHLYTGKIIRYDPVRSEATLVAMG